MHSLTEEAQPATVKVFTPPLELFSRSNGSERTVVKIGPVSIGAGQPVVIAGPCSVESYEQVLATARAVKAAGAVMLRGGAYKPRTSPYDFQGLGLEALQILRQVRQETGLPIVSEVLSTDDIEAVAEHVDMLQVGARNMQNFALLRRLGQLRKPVLLKRSPAATVKEWTWALMISSTIGPSSPSRSFLSSSEDFLNKVVYTDPNSPNPSRYLAARGSVLMCGYSRASSR